MGAHAVPAGLSVPPLVPSTLTGELPEPSKTSPSSSSLTAAHTITVATVASTPTPGPTSNHTVRCSLPSTHTLEDRHLAEIKTPAKSESAIGKLFPEAPSYSIRLPLTLVSFPSLSLPETDLSRCTEAVSSTTHHAQPRSTTPSLWSVMVTRVAKTTGSLETPGAPTGVTKVTSS